MMFGWHDVLDQEQAILKGNPAAPTQRRDRALQMYLFYKALMDGYWIELLDPG